MLGKDLILGILVQVYISSTWEAEAVLYEDSLGYIMKPCLKKQNKREPKETKQYL